MPGLTTQFIYFCFDIFILYWIVAAFSTKPVAKGHREGNWRLYALVLAIAIFYLLRIPAGPRGGFILWQHTLFLGIVADIVALCGLSVLLWARVILGGNWSANVVIKENHELIERGPYAYVRHPIYSGALLMVLAIVINDGRLRWLILFAIVCAGLYIKARLEENVLTKHFPEAYPKYKAKVKALIPSLL